MDSSSADTGGDKPRVLKSATLLSRGLGSSGEGAGFRGQSGPAHVNMANGGSGPQKDYSLHGTQLNRKEGAFADHINLNERREELQPSLHARDVEGRVAGFGGGPSGVGAHISGENPIKRDEEGNHEDDGKGGAADELPGDEANVSSCSPLPFGRQEAKVVPLESIHSKAKGVEIIADGSALKSANNSKNEASGASASVQIASETTERNGPPLSQAVGDEDATVGPPPSHAPGDDADTAGPPRPPAAADEATVVPSPKQGKGQKQKPTLKKPDKLAPCPRCDSLDTKFCYYNNYNVNQPRHFCKNCQRYWTAGGILRNVPVGAGRRKIKHSSSHPRHGAVPDIPAVRLDSLDMAQLRPCLSRGSSVPHQVSPLLTCNASSPSNLNSLLNRQERGSSEAITQTRSMHVAEAVRRHYISESQVNIASDSGNRLLHAEHSDGCEPVLACEAEKDDCVEACTSSATGSPSRTNVTPPTQEAQSMLRGPPTTLIPVCGGVVRPVGILDGSVWTAAPSPFGLFNGSWPYGYNVGWSGPAPGAPGPPICPPGGTLVSCQPAVTWSSPPNGIWSGICWGSTLIPGMPTGMPGPPWMSPGWGGGWPIPWGPDAAAAAAAASASASFQTASAPMSGSGFPPVQSRLPIRPVLNKHPRDRPDLDRVESSLWLPKMVKVDDSGSAPRSSVWTAVGAENRVETVVSGSNFKAFLPVADSKASDTS
ncbi:uncharacterized protein [Physcomitrium patens]|uniref:Dof-type domain-containing protein n=1 Tax=Physcomitrium patens TaxID=3218 RepID=A0A2K1KW53_PHYPA|nr:uncharacterized protein LOC112280065 isoform X2 [Physcomitrium patens]PNR57998.1 hypothetical protein PHYPA_004993 [Physcomitrium patens]|eukprot:XP_024370809.1 uncharacterized protein LOC112280065 isoform X2 [Physcomitrella patens]